MGVQTIENIKNAYRILNFLTNSNSRVGCMEISMAALGADINPQQASQHYEIINAENHNTITYLDRYGLVTTALIQFDTYTSEGEISEIIENPKRPYSLCGETPPAGYIKGFIVEMSAINKKKKGHAVAVLHRDNLPRNDRRTMKTLNRHVMVDTLSPELITETDAGSLATSVNTLIDRGYNTSFYFVRRRRR